MGGGEVVLVALAALREGRRWNGLEALHPRDRSIGATGREERELQRLAGACIGVFAGIPQHRLELDLGFVQLGLSEGRLAQLLGQESDHRPKIPGEAVGVDVDGIATGTHVHLGAEARQRLVDLELVPALGTRLQQHGRQLGHRRVGGPRLALRIAQRHDAHHGHHIGHVHGIDDDVDAG